MINDLMNSACESNETEKAFAKYVYHRNLSVQKFFCQGKKSCTVTLNTKYMVLLENPRDNLQVVSLARQMYPTRPCYF